MSLPRPLGRPRFARVRDALGSACLFACTASETEVSRDVVSPTSADSTHARTSPLIARREKLLGLLLLRESAWRNGRLDGPEVWHSLRGDARRRIDWRDGRPHGTWREWHGNGVKALECSLEHGRLQGKCSAWRRDGTKRFLGEYREGAMTGEWYFVKADGTLDRERTGLYVDGERLGGIKGFNEWLGSP